MTTTIEWTDETWNPVVGCDRISPGCAKCYAKDLHDRRHKAFLAGRNVPAQYAQPFEVLQTFDRRLDTPLRWKRPRRVFVNSMSDLFHEDVPATFIADVMAVCAKTPQHTYQILTKRPARMLELFRDPPPDVLWPLTNVWLGVSVENQHFADERIPLLLQTPAAVRFISAEPLLGPVHLEPHLTREWEPSEDYVPFKGIDWVIVGGESGPQARPMDLAWARAIVQQCQAAGVPVFVKQLGARPFGLSHRPDQGSLVLSDRKGGDPSEWPEDLRVRQYPDGRR